MGYLTRAKFHAERLLRPWLFPPHPGSLPAAKAAQVALFAEFQARARAGGPLPALDDVGFRAFSPCDEDGKLLFLLAVAGMRTRCFLEIGGGNCSDSNCTNLILNWNFHGLFVDGNPRGIERGRRFFERHPDSSLFPPKCVSSFVTAENVNELVKGHGLTGEVDVLSIDIDGNDYWIWKALRIVSPRIVVIESHVEYGNRSIVVPYDPAFAYPGKHSQYFGASAVALTKLGRSLGYRLVGANNHGFNLIFLRNGEADGLVGEIPVERVLDHPRTRSRLGLTEPVKDWAYVEV